MGYIIISQVYRLSLLGGAIMGMCKPSGGKFDMIGKVGSLPILWEPNTRIDLYDGTGKLLQQAWYGPE